MSNIKQSSYLDGVPFAINPIFLTGDQKNDLVQLKEAHDIIESDMTESLKILDFEYDFVHEIKFLNSEAKLRKKALKASAQLLSEKLHKQQMKDNLTTQMNLTENSNNNDNVSNTQHCFSRINANGTASNSIPNVHINSHSLNMTNQASIYNSEASNQGYKPSYSNSTLLEPTRSTPNQSSSTNNINSTNTSSALKKPVLNQQDSLNDMFNPNGIQSLDPFNDMELKTINDLEELKSILHNHQIDSRQGEIQMAQSKRNKEADTNTINKILGLENKQLPLSLTGAQDNYGLPNVSFPDLDFNSNKLK